MEGQNNKIDSSKAYLENLVTATQQSKADAVKGRRQALKMEQIDHENIDQELIEKAFMEMGDELNRKNSTLATEEDEQDSDSPNEEEILNTIDNINYENI